MSRAKTGRRFKVSFAEKHPELSAEWHPTRNGALRAVDVSPGSGKRVWWQCAKSSAHEWDAVIAKRRAGSGCPYCAGKKIAPDTSLRAKHPELAAQWHGTKNGRLTADDVTAGSMRRVWYEATPSNPAQGATCACSGVDRNRRATREVACAIRGAVASARVAPACAARPAHARNRSAAG